MNSQQIILGKKEVVKTSDKKVLLKFRISKYENGIKIFIQSDCIENFFKENGVNERTGSWNNHKPYYLNKSMKANYRDRLSYWGGTLFYEEQPNLSYLTCQGLTEGVTLTDHNVYSEDEIKDFNKKFSNDVLEFYKQYIKPNEHEVIIYLEERSNKEIE